MNNIEIIAMINYLDNILDRSLKLKWALIKDPTATSEDVDGIKANIKDYLIQYKYLKKILFNNIEEMIASDKNA